MSPDLAAVWKRCLETHDALNDCLEQFPDDRFLWRPAPAARTAAEIIAHVARGECVYAQCLKPQAHERPVFAAHGSEEAGRPGALVASDRASSLRVVEIAFNYAAGVVRAATEADLQRVAADHWQPLGPLVQGPLTGLWFIEQMNRHKAYHLGQLWYLITMLDEAAAR